MPGSSSDVLAGPAATGPVTRTRLTLLGGFRLDRGDTTLSPPASGRRLLAVLGLHGPMSRADAASTLWQDASERHALGSLRTTVWRLHKVAPDLVDARDEYLRLAPDVDVDVAEFAAWARRLLRPERIRADDLDGPATAPGELLPGWLEDWARYERERLRQLRLHAWESLAQLLCRRGEHARAIDAALEAIRLEPLRESAHLTLITVHLAEHNAAEAVRQFAAFRRLLAAELGIEPSARLAALVERLR
jgi:DNA-binding SARP family transcriptional activator